eukprot:CAMPEP_0170602824 /NCGR_PEP_ID=MMETSP0224-20130122/18594_1 /TAXON_ID=285029 /ORGANISM="Togula jolla, Strain CCCM 725" /LENGTH=145 /DNA_ID=CAMNT_0010927683 /DNA_START=57 /DNA_END=494 /DNA_ORIENTATION=-
MAPQQKMGVSMRRSKAVILPIAVGLFFLGLLYLPSGPATSGPSHSPALSLEIPNLSKFNEAVDRAGGTRVVVGAAAVGAIGGMVSLSPLPVLGQLGAPLGAAAGIYCAQLPKGKDTAGKAGEFCRDVGRAATAFWTVLQSEMKKD